MLRASGEMRGGLDELGREALVALRTMIDHYLERTDADSAATRVEQIPID